MKWTVTCLFMIFSNVYGERWIIFGGYVNVEGGPDTKPLDSVELLTLDNEGEIIQNHLQKLVVPTHLPLKDNTFVST